MPASMPVRATKRGAQRTPLSGSWDVLICGASFAGLAVARELRGSGARVLIVDRYEVGERQTSACAAPTEWLVNLGLEGSIRQTVGSLLVHTPSRSLRWRVPFTFSTFDYRTLCALLHAQGDAEFETAKVDGRTGFTVHTDRGDLTAPLIVDALGWRRVLSRAEPGIQPPEARLSRGLEVHPSGNGADLELWLDPSYVRAGYSWSFPAGEELRVGVGSFDPRNHVKEPTVRLAGDLDVAAGRHQGKWIPPQMRRPGGPLSGQLDPPPDAPPGRGRRVLLRRLGGPLPADDGRGHPHRALLRARVRARAPGGGRGAAGRRTRPDPLRGLLRPPRAGVPVAAARAEPRLARQPDAVDDAGAASDVVAAVHRVVVRPLPADRAAGVRAGGRDRAGATVGGRSLGRRRSAQTSVPCDAPADGAVRGTGRTPLARTSRTFYMHVMQNVTLVRQGTSRPPLGAAVRALLDPEVRDHLRVALVPRAEREDLEPLGPGLERARHARRHADRVERADRHDVVVELDAPVTGEDDVDLLGLLVAVTEGRALARLEDEVHEAGPLGLEVAAREARLLDLAEPVLGGQVLDLAEVADRVAHARVRQNPRRSRADVRRGSRPSKWRWLCAQPCAIHRTISTPTAMLTPSTSPGFHAPSRTKKA